MSGVAGRWRILEMDLWDLDDLDLIGPAFIEFNANGTGRFAFIAVEAGMDCRDVARAGRPGAEFSWDGHDDGDPVSGRGWAAVTHDGMLRGHIYFHQGDDSGFRAIPFNV